MFACVYFQKDATLSVVHEKSPDLTIITKFEKRHQVEMRWRVANKKTKETFAGVIIKVGGKFYLINLQFHANIFSI